ncbi:MAG: helix-turn-helix transcriptional regulator [Oscillospiraceae bacterium]|nr:helix-turn-helix transcriptional regulator [Oscillospiraceae bacterium]
MAERTNLSVPYISHIENGIKKASLQAVVNIAEALECTADRLLCEDQPDSSNTWQPELAELLSDCTAAEQQLLLEILIAVKLCAKAQADG